MSLHLLRPGLLTTIQDAGRPGYRQAGVSVGGPLDARALRVANLLVGNPTGAAALEVTLLGPTIQFTADHLLALCGADLSATLNGQPLPLNRAVAVRAGTQLAFGRPRAGCRAYLAVAGGLAVPMVLGSRATYLAAGIGGLAGRALRAEDVLAVAEPAPAANCLRQQLLARSPELPCVAAPWFAAPTLTPQPEAKPVLRAVRGPEYGQFTAASQQAFWTKEFQVTPASNRMGSRLAGLPLLRTAGAPELLSAAVTFGTVQVPPGGQPIVLLADHQTTGGYPRLALVAATDWPQLAQVPPGGTVRFQEISLPEAQQLYIAQENQLRQLERAVALRWPM
ncbi:5-oxoprolinase subunit C family protein [Hymenobacter rubripertinctus]|uniref:Biotin-dependent carboxyltransferase family protein n=1 Tax=Hymenobacter rubripertinctus TaxID=2029981 RepID=A0A418QM83_9BACT|nr:biotin-dependent carboxyltransferase family protein [Hymenobacter rubripertinctus]RIY06218.1 biotin-dependent carboxyltransferase family protein [Hymenobacter rubripertinctus]